MKNFNLYKCILNGIITKENYFALRRIITTYKFIFNEDLLNLIIKSKYSSVIINQFLPNFNELNVSLHDVIDPIGDSDNSPLKGIVHRYKNRVLLKPHYFCAAYCRFCFRRELIGTDFSYVNKHELFSAIQYIKLNKNIYEVILSGGDPLFLSSSKIKFILEQLSQTHIHSIRVHTRLPIITPSLIDDNFINSLNTKKLLSIIIHCNHPDELSKESLYCLRKLHNSGIKLFSQTVLLKNVNDCEIVLRNLFLKLFKNQIQPYYLHQLDFAKGTSHFRVPLSKALYLIKNLRLNLSNICIPQFIIDIPGGYSKINAETKNVLKISNNKYLITDIFNNKHIYYDF